MGRYQSFDVMDCRDQVAERVAALRKLFATHKIDGYLVPRGDEFRGEYVPEHAERLAYITGFTGSWGLSLILKDSADLYIDSRYKIQAPEQTDTDIFDVICVPEISLDTRLAEKIGQNHRIGFDPMLFSRKEIARFEKTGAIFVPVSENLIDLSHGEALPEIRSEILIHPIEIAGASFTEKKKQIIDILQKKNCDALFIVLPENICWLLNLRGNDVPHTPFILSRAIVTIEGKFYWYVGKERVTPALKEHLGPDVICRDSDDIFADIKMFHNQKILYDPIDTAFAIEKALQDNGVKLISDDDPILLLKAIKNNAEQAATRKAHIRDAVAMIKFAHWFSTQQQDFTEIDAVKQLEDFRSEAPELKDISFDTISGSGANGAIVHYRVSHKSDKIIAESDLFLCDSGGQYLDGTTDITRVFIRGKATAEQKTRYTQVLKGHLAVARALFPIGTTGAVLDVLARAPLWQAGIDFGHGTGHGVGLYLSVHEGPQGISSRSKVKLEPGMLLSNEPGYYKAGEFGIRIENVELIVHKGIPEDGEKNMLGFETLTLVPYERKLIDKSLLSREEIHQIDTYHQRISDSVIPLLDAERASFLKDQCAPL
ncbi:MAG: aminopeptidase P family protein [Pseudomonadota bacterium]